MGKNNIIFFYPSKVVGGAEFLFARLALYLKHEFNLNVYYIDYSDGFVKNNDDFKDLNFIEYKDNTTELNVSGTFITPISKIYSLSDELLLKNETMKIFFWCLHPYNILHVMPDSKLSERFAPEIYKFILKFFAKHNYNIFYKLLKCCSECNAIYYMDYLNYSFNKFFFENAVEEKYLPIATDDRHKLLNNNVSNVINEDINVCYLGRLCKEKTTALLNLAHNLNGIKTKRKINLHIIGDGSERKRIKVKNYENVNFIFVGTLTDRDLDEYLINKIDILFAMGLSLLEGAKLKIPTVVVPFSYKDYKINKFHYLYKEEKYNLGEDVKSYSKKDNINFSQIIDDIYEKNKKGDIGQQCYEFYCRTHSLETISTKLLQCIEQNVLTVDKYNQIKLLAGKTQKNKNLIIKILRSLL